MELSGAEALHLDKNKIEQLCVKHKIKLLILHGSYAKGRATDKSDIDIGILSETKFVYDKYSEILRDFGGIFGDRFDPVFLNGVEPMISYHAAISGLPLYESKHGNFAEFRVQTIGRYLDTKKFRDLERTYVKKDIDS